MRELKREQEEIITVPDIGCQPLDFFVLLFLNYCDLYRPILTQ